MDAIYPTYRENPGLHAGFWKRVVAYLIDSIIRLGATLLIVTVLVLLGDPAYTHTEDGSEELGLAGIVGTFLMAALWLFYHPLFEGSRHQATPGKMLLGVQVVDQTGQPLSMAHAFGRHLAGVLSYLSSFALYFGYWLAGLTARKQALHDLVAGTLVVNADAAPHAHLTPDPAQRPGRSSMPVWAVLLIIIAALVPVAAIIAAISIPAYVDYQARSVVFAAYSEASAHRIDIVEHYQRNGRLPMEQGQLPGHWPITVADNQASVYYQSGLLLIRFSTRAPQRLQGEMIGLGFYRKADGQLGIQCGHQAADGLMLSEADSSEATTLEDRLLPADCRPNRSSM